MKVRLVAATMSNAEGTMAMVKVLSYRKEKK